MYKDLLRYLFRDIKPLFIALAIGGFSSICIVKYIESSYRQFGIDVCAQYREYDEKGKLRGYAKEELLGMSKIEFGCRVASRQVSEKYTWTYFSFLLFILIGPSLWLASLIMGDD